MTELARPAALGRSASGVRPDEASLATRTVVMLAGVGGVAWTAVVGWWAVWRHNQFLSHRADLGHMVQTVWSTAHGHPLGTTDDLNGEFTARLAGHVDPILVLLAPLWWLHPDPATLIVAQAAALAAGIYPVVRLALKHVGSPLAAVLFGAWYLVYPWTVWLAFDDFHPLTLATPLLLYCVWFLDEERFGLFALFAVLAVMTGELVGLTIAALGVWCVVRYRRVWTGLTIALGGAAWTAICLTLVQPAFNDGRSSRHYALFDEVGGSPSGVLATLFTDPGAIVEQMTSTRDLLYPVKLLLPTALLALGQPMLLLVAAPQLGVNLLVGWIAATLPMFHYTAPIVPVLIAATIMTVARFPKRMQIAAAGTAFASALVILVSYPPVPGSQGFAFSSLESSERRAAMRRALEVIPPAAPVAATNRLGAHLSTRRDIYIFPRSAGADWVVVDTRDVTPAGSPGDERRFEAAIARLDGDSRWRLVFDEQAVRVYRRTM